jgi:hypothetical protein
MYTCCIKIYCDKHLIAKLTKLLKFSRICYRRRVHIYQTARYHMTEHCHINEKYVFRTKCHAVHNVSFQMTPTLGDGREQICTTAGCTVYLNSRCPDVVRN